MAVDALTPNDPRVKHKFLPIGDHTYHYIVAKPSDEPACTIILLHGWPDTHLSWRFQVPYLVSLGYEVITPDLLGYGQTSAPDSPQEYTMKKMASHIAAIIKANTSQPVILGGHDWGGVLVWRVAMYYPELVRAAFSFTTPYFPSSPALPTLEKLVEAVPTFRYQFSNRDGAVEAAVAESPAHLEGFLNACFCANTLEGEPGFEPEQGVHPDRLVRVQASTLLTPEMRAHLVQEFSRVGFRGPCNWYRTTEYNIEDELAFAKEKPGFKFDIHAMIVMSENDPFLPPVMMRGMEAHFTQDLKKATIAAAHWAQLEKPEEANALIEDFVTSVIGERTL